MFSDSHRASRGILVDAMSNLRFSLLGWLVLSAVACTVEPEGDDASSSNPGTGASTSTGGTLSGGTGGSAPSGGASTGGVNTGGVSTGGAVNTGGFVGTGATTSTGGTGSGGLVGSGSTGVGGSSTGGAATGGETSTGGASSGGAATGGTGGSACPHEGNVTYTLAKAAQPTTAEQEAYDLITAAMDEAITYYNCHTDIERALNVTYNSGVATADGNPNGSIRFGQKPYMNHITAMHEMSHVFGIGDSKWDSLIQNGIFPGAAATAELRAITGIADDQLHGDMQHFWPYGLNQTSEVQSEQDLLNHCRMVMAIREDLGL